MAKEIGAVERKSRKSGAGSFFLGGFIGFLLCLALIAGALCFVYFKVSPNWINKTFKTEIDLGSEEANKKTVKDFVTSVWGLAQDIDTYTLSNLKKDFGIEVKDEIIGINISDLKNVGLSDLPDAIEEKFGTISAKELKNVQGMNLEEEMGNILNKKVTYYFNTSDEELYKDAEYKTLASFKFKLNEEKDGIYVKNEYIPIVSNTVSIELWYLPLTVAIGDFTSSLGDNLTLYDLTENYGVKLPTFFNFTEQELKDTTVNELQSAINDLYVADFLGYTIDKTDPDNIVVKNGNEVVEGFEAAVSQFTIGGLADGMKDLKIKDVLKSDDLQKGILSLINKEAKLTELPGEIKYVIENKTIEDFVTAEVVAQPGNYNETTKNYWIKVGESGGQPQYKQVKNLLMQDIVNVIFANIDLIAQSTNPNA